MPSPDANRKAGPLGVRIAAGIFIGLPLGAVLGAAVGGFLGVLCGALAAFLVWVLWLLLRVLAWVGWRYLTFGGAGGFLMSCGACCAAEFDRSSTQPFRVGVIGSIIGAVLGGVNGYFQFVPIDFLHSWLQVPTAFLVGPIVVGIVAGATAGAFAFETFGIPVLLSASHASGPRIPFAVTGLTIAFALVGLVLGWAGELLYGWMAWGWPADYLPRFSEWVTRDWRGVPIDFLGNLLRGGWIDEKTGAANWLTSGWPRIIAGTATLGAYATAAIGGVIGAIAMCAKFMTGSEV